MEIFVRVVIAVFVFLLFGWIGLVAGDVGTTYTDAIITGLVGVCATFIVLDFSGKKESDDNKKDK